MQLSSDEVLAIAHRASRHSSLHRGIASALAGALLFAGCAMNPGDDPAVGEPQQAGAAVAVIPITWGVIGLDSTNVNVGPNAFPVGVRITNTGDQTATNLSASFAFTTANAHVDVDGPSTVKVASLAPGARSDVYFNVRITRTTAAYDTARRFVVTVAGDNIATATSPSPREVYVAKLVAQNRNSIAGITGPTSVVVGDTVSYVLDGSMSTGGHEQVEAYLTLPSDVFQVLSTTTTYTSPADGTNDKVYTDACGSDPVPTSLTYRDCIGPDIFAGGKAGGAIRTTYNVLVIGTGAVSLTAAIYDLSGSSYHYNADYGALAIGIVSSPLLGANDDSATVAEDAAATAIDVLANDTGVSGLPIVSVTQPSDGAVVITGGGTGVTFQPEPDFHGTTTFTYTLSDGLTESLTATVTVTVTPLNDEPVAVNDTKTVAEDAAATAIDVLDNDDDVDGDGLNVASVVQPANGTVVITGGGTGVTFQPAPDFHGTTSFTYMISDGFGGTATATVTVTVTPVNDPPVAVDDSATVAEDAAATPINVLANDSDADGHALTILSVVQPVDGTVAITGGGTGVSFQPAPGFSGPTAFSYTISDDHGGTATAVVEVSVTAVNDPPSAVDDVAITPEETAASINALVNDSDVEGDPLTIVSVTQPQHGSVVITGGGTGLSFQPAANFHGATSFSYTTSDGQGGTATATVEVIVTSVNDPPVALDDAATVAEDAAATAIAVLANDSDIDDDTLAIESVTQPTQGTVVITGGGTGLTFQPAAGFSGTASFTYTIFDDHGGTDTATVTVTPAVHPVVVSNDSTAVPDGGGPTVINVLANDGSNLTIVSVTQPAHGTATIINSGTAILYVPDPSFTGIVSFMYTVSDGDGGSATATVTITVTASALPDRDSDGRPDVLDNCPDNPNTAQTDSDRDGKGDICDPGFNSDVGVAGGGCQSSGGSTSGALVVLLGWLAVARGRRRRSAQ
jgi:hypothetical protein